MGFWKGGLLLQELEELLGERAEAVSLAADRGVPGRKIAEQIRKPEATLAARRANAGKTPHIREPSDRALGDTQKEARLVERERGIQEAPQEAAMLLQEALRLLAEFYAGVLRLLEAQRPAPHA